MATDVDVQYFSHLNGLTLGNNWGDLIRLLDKALVTGLDFTQITAASIDAQGDVHITLYASHNAMLLQVVELSGFAPASLNQKYRIKGVPSTTELILKPHTLITETSITTVGAGKLASLGYDIIFRDANDVKRVYRAKNPTAQHPYIRIDESLTSPDGTTGVYTPTYAKYAMVGLLEHMEHIDDYENPDVQQLPFDPADPARNWKITGAGTGVVRGWSRWYWNKNLTNIQDQVNDTSSANRNTTFTLVGSKDHVYFLRNIGNSTGASKSLCGLGLFEPTNQGASENGWFLMSAMLGSSAGTATNHGVSVDGAQPLTNNQQSNHVFFLSNINNTTSPMGHITATGLIPDHQTGWSNYAAGYAWSGVTIPIRDGASRLRGTLSSILYLCNRPSITQATAVLNDTSMFVSDAVNTSYSASNVGAFLFYLGELE